MQKNVSGTERLIRAVIGIALIYWAMTPTGPMLAAGFGGFIVLLTAIVGWCPVYKIFGINTRKARVSA